MWISDVDVPEELLAAARAGKLVIFVGAGASRDAPASLPDFDQLTRDIVGEANLTTELDVSASPDRTLGLVEDAGVDVHQRVKVRIDQPGSAPNALHEAIVGLAAATGAPRIVTTNYDNHLTTAMHVGGLAWTEYMAPALPMGDDFEGVVYLHGSLRQEPRHLIVTDADFGRAYIRDAWAARFLERMFPTFTVLFVGYSYSDVVLRYLARSLGRRASRFVLTHKPEDRDWGQLGLTPVGYDLRGSSHIGLTEAIDRWARLLTMGLLDHRQRIARLVAAPPSAIPEEASYLLSVIGDERTAGLFTDLAGGEEWLHWAADQLACRPLFDPGARADAYSWVFARWFSRHWLADEASTSAGLTIVSAAGGLLSPALWSALGQELHTHQSPRPTWLHPWIALLVENAPAKGGDWLEYALVASRLPDDRDVALLLFDYLTEPHLVPRSTLGLGGAAHFDVEPRGDEYWLRESWEKVLQPALPSIIHDILPIADRHLRRARWLLVAAGSANGAWDPVSFGRSSIAPHGQDRYGDKIGLLIDVARECLELLTASNPESATAVIRAWLDSALPVLRRLALHGIAVSDTRTGDEKLAWLLEGGYLSEHQLKHEAYELLAVSLPSASHVIVDQVVGEVTRPRGDGEETEVSAYESFNALVWIDRYSAAPSAKSALAEARARHADFGVREHPDFDTWSESGYRGYAAPMPPDELHEQLHRDRAAALAELEKYKAVRFPLDQPSWEDAIELVRRMVAEHPADGFVVLGGDPEPDDDLVRAVIEGWSSSSLEEEVARRVIDRLSTVDLARWGGDLARLLGAQGGNGQRTEWAGVDGARDLARAVAQHLPKMTLSADGSHWLDRAVSEPGGQLTLFWLRAVSHDWSADRTGWEGLDAQSRDAIDKLLGRNDQQGAFAEIVVASQLHFFFAADREWCQANAMPLLNWGDPECARRTWDGFLFWGRWTDQLLVSGLLRAYLDTVPHVAVLESGMQRRLAEHLAAVALYSETDPGTWLSDFTRAAPVSLIVDWMNQVAWTLGRLDANLRRLQWARWMRDYWARRIDSIPKRLTPEEGSALAGWVVYVDDATEEAVALALATPAGLNQHGQTLLEISRHVEQAPVAYAKLTGHLLAGTERPLWSCDLVEEIFAKVRGDAPEEVVRQIREESLRLGCAKAADW